MADKFQLKAIISAVDKLSPTLKGIRLNAKITQKSLMDIRSATGNLIKSVGLGGVAVGAGIFGALKKVLDESAKFERFEAVLKTVEGSAEAAKKSIRWVDKFSNDTPYDLDEVTEAYVQLRAYGIDPTLGSLKSVGDAATAMNKPIMDVVNALSSGIVGNNESLKQFGITVKKVGKDFVYSWNENGKAMVARAATNNRALIETTITGIWNRRYAGAMKEQAEGWDGLWAMAKGHYLNFMRFIGEKGTFSAIKQQLKGLIDLSNKWADDGTLERLASEASAVLVGSIQDIAGWVKSVNWAAFYQGIKSTIVSIRDFVSAIGGLKTILIALGAVWLVGPVASIIQIIQAIGRLLPSLALLKKAFLFLGLANPVVLGVVAVIALLAGAAYLIYKNWGPIKAWFGELWEFVKKIFLQAWDNIKTVLSWSPLGLIMRAWGPVAKFFGGIWENVKGISNARPVQTSVPNAGGFGNRDNLAGLHNRTRVDGEMVVKFENAPPGMRVSESKTNQPGFGLNPDVGHHPLGFYGM